MPSTMVKVFCNTKGKVCWANESQKKKENEPRCTGCGQQHKRGV